MLRAFAKGNASAARDLHARFYPLHKELFVEPNPVPVQDGIVVDEGLDAAGRAAAALRDERSEFEATAPDVGQRGVDRGVNADADVPASPVAVVLCGAGGRMGLAIVACAQREPDRYRIAGHIGRNDDPTGMLARGENRH